MKRGTQRDFVPTWRRCRLVEGTGVAKEAAGVADAT